MARRNPSQLSGKRLVNAITARSNDPGTRAPKEKGPLSVDPAVGELVIASALAKYASFLRAGMLERYEHATGERFQRAGRSGNALVPPEKWQTIWETMMKPSGTAIVTIAEVRPTQH